MGFDISKIHLVPQEDTDKKIPKNLSLGFWINPLTLRSMELPEVGQAHLELSFEQTLLMNMNASYSHSVDWFTLTKYVFLMRYSYSMPECDYVYLIYYFKNLTSLLIYRVMFKMQNPHVTSGQISFTIFWKLFEIVWNIGIVRNLKKNICPLLCG